MGDGGAAKPLLTSALVEGGCQLHDPAALPVGKEPPVIIINISSSIMAIQPFVGPWPLFQFIDPKQSP
jgi:hypothetical protein